MSSHYCHGKNALTAAVIGLGCKVNAYETEKIKNDMQNAGFEIVPFSGSADVYVINTCAVTGVAAQKSRKLLHRARRQNNESLIVAVGCLADLMDKGLAGTTSSAGVDFNKTLIQEKLSDNSNMDGQVDNETQFDLLIPLKGKDIISKLIIEKLLAKQKISQNQSSTGEGGENLTADESARNITDFQKTDGHPRVKSYLKIQDGCNRFCSYCIIPYARGRSRSRQYEAIMEEAAKLCHQYKEIIITGIDISSYGIDMGIDPAEALISLLEKLDDLPGDFRIRLGSLEPQLISEHFVIKLKKIKRLCPHFHLSLQSGSDTVLRRMNRKYTAARYSEKTAIFRQYFDKPGITTDLIVGFPQESAEEFRETLNFVEKIGFSRVHIFPFSAVKGTVACKMNGQVNSETKRIREKILIQTAEICAIKYNQQFLGKTTQVLWESVGQIGQNKYLFGYNAEYCRVASKEDFGRIGLPESVRVIASQGGYIFV